jgi:hypothetical protein
LSRRREVFAASGAVAEEAFMESDAEVMQQPPNFTDDALPPDPTLTWTSGKGERRRSS